MKWIKDKEWHGNPALGLESWHCRFANPLDNNRRVPVYVWGKGKKWHFTVSAGANSDFSYTGSSPRPCKNAQEMMKHVEERYAAGKLFY
jgi:hypothetical protein